MAKVEPPGLIGPMMFVEWLNRLIQMHNEQEDEIEELKKRIEKLEKAGKRSGRKVKTGDGVAEGKAEE